MKALRNLGHHERIIRVSIGVILLALSGFSMLPGWGDLLLMIVGLIALLTGLVGYCPAWHAVGLNTCKVHHDQTASGQKGGVHEHDTPTTQRS
ncbi:MAG: DUF2892 domain-containing protein [Nitrospirota bacterium]|nr:DUF2892 domain-containing protein [Nitrospirota bacterium]MDH5776475.1 DUF2892 domain-containing protein [Nitrospirota bacterium]